MLHPHGRRRAPGVSIARQMKSGSILSPRAALQRQHCNALQRDYTHHNLARKRRAAEVRHNWGGEVYQDECRQEWRRCLSYVGKIWSCHSPPAALRLAVCCIAIHSQAGRTMQLEPPAVLFGIFAVKDTCCVNVYRLRASRMHYSREYRVSQNGS